MSRSESPPRVLLVETDPIWYEPIMTWVQEISDQALVRHCRSYKAGRRELDQRTWDLLITDVQALGPPAEKEDRLGLVLAQQALAKQIPTIIVTAKPFSAAELNPLYRIAGNTLFGFFDKYALNYDEFKSVVGEALKIGPPRSSGPPNQAITRAHHVFVCHGRNARALSELTKFLRYIGLQPTSFSGFAAQQNGKATIDIVRLAIERADAVIVLFTPDEQVQLAEHLRDASVDSEAERRLQARANVLFEAGAAMALQPARTVLVRIGSVELPSNIAGLNCVRLANDLDSRFDLTERLHHAGCEVSQRLPKLSDTSVAGDFEGCLLPNGTDGSSTRQNDGRRSRKRSRREPTIASEPISPPHRPRRPR